ncbi:MAG TPA: M28 family metallopeptidase [Gemmatimonadaceae bacterium]|nr:M28 family metallopeptidase [Gemmatimonadaceae bacterium]
MARARSQLRPLALALLIPLAAAPRALAAQQPAPALAARYRADADRLIEAALADSAAWNRIARLTETFGPRFSGTPELERAIDWVMAEMRRDGLENVRGEPAMVPRWVRGRESVELVSPRRAELPMLGLGGSIATPKDGVTAEVLVVSSFDDLRANAARAKGKIVLYDVPVTSYGETVRYRSAGAVEAAKVGAVASLIRSVGPYSMRNPHTGSMRYDSTVARIPAAAITVEDAAMLHRMQERGEKVVVRLAMEAQTLPDVPSRNVMGEIRGRERPEEVVVMGGHIDSWDVGRGAMDDAGGVVVAWEAVRLMKKLGLRPRRTIRVVGWTNEENGTRGGTAYRDAHRAELDDHILAIESDGGVFKPQGFGFTGSDSALAVVKQVATLLERIGAGTINKGGGGADIGPIMQLGVPGMGLDVDDTRYFWYHHSDADTVDKLDPHEVALCVATMAVMAYVIADMPERLPRGAAATQ